VLLRLFPSESLRGVSGGKLSELRLGVSKGLLGVAAAMSCVENGMGEMLLVLLGDS
jgi:hypothetical protein